jgi:hypothetical protein
VVKEHCRATRHSLPFQWIPKLLTIHIVLNAVKLLNFFPTKGGVSDTLSPKTIMSGETLNYKKHLCLQIGQYSQVHEEDTPYNSQIPRTKGTISLGSSGNLQGRFKFMALSSEKKIIRHSWDGNPMPDTVIVRVNTLGSNQPEQLIFADQLGHLIGDSDEAEIPGVVYEDDNVEIPGVDFKDDDADIPGVDIVEFPGVDVADMEANHAPQIN